MQCAQEKEALRVNLRSASSFVPYIGVHMHIARESAQLSKEDALLKKLQYTMDAVNSRDRFTKGAVLDEDLEGAIAWISSQTVHEVRCNNSSASFCVRHAYLSCRSI